MSLRVEWSCVMVHAELFLAEIGKLIHTKGCKGVLCIEVCSLFAVHNIVLHSAIFLEVLGILLSILNHPLGKLCTICISDGWRRLPSRRSHSPKKTSNDGGAHCYNS